MYRDPVRSVTVRGNTRVLCEPGASGIEGELDAADRRVELDVAARETALHRKAVVDIEAFAGPQIRRADEQDQVVDLSCGRALFLLCARGEFPDHTVGVLHHSAITPHPLLCRLQDRCAARNGALKERIDGRWLSDDK